jgi:hypothetical protein
VDTEACNPNDKKEITATTVRKLLSDAAYKIRIQYFMSDERIEGRKYKVLSGTGVSLKSAAKQVDVASRIAKAWHLVGFPMSGLLPKIMVNQNDPLPDSIKDTTFVLQVHRNDSAKPSQSPFDTLGDWTGSHRL